MSLKTCDLVTLKRDDLARLLFKENVGINTSLEASDVAKSVVFTYQNALVEGKSLALSGIGHLVILDKSPRPGRNPKTGEKYEISARRTVSMRKAPQSEKPYLKRQDMLSRLKEALSEFKNVDVVKVYNVFHEFIKSVEDKKHRVEFRGLGIFYPSVREAGEVRNPKTGKRTFSKERVRISFRPSKKMLKLIN
jgi:integration host factor subunit alpha